MQSTFKINPAYLAMGQALVLQLGQTFAAVNPLVGLGLAAYQTITGTIKQLALQSDVLARAQAEGWTMDDPRWDAPLAEQTARMEEQDRRHAELVAQQQNG